MISKVASYWNYGKSFCSIELTARENKDEFYGVLAKKDANEFKSIETFFAEDYKELASKLPKNQHCFLTINTDKVLVKETRVRDNAPEIIMEAFPGLNLEEFFVQIFTSGELAVVSICRRKYIEEILKIFEEKKISVLGFFLGCIPFIHLVPYLKEDTVHINRFDLFLEDKKIRKVLPSIKTIEEHYTIEDLTVSSNHLLSLAGLFGYISAIESYQGNTEAQNAHLLKLHKEKTFFRKGLVVGIGILLSLLLLNTLIFSNSYGKYQTLQQESELVSSQKEAYKTRLAELEGKEKIVQNIVNNESSKVSFYLNRIISEMPDSHQLEKLNYQPLLKTVREDKLIEYEEKVIIIEGISYDKNTFGSWIQTMEAKLWISSVIVSGFSEINDSDAQFELKITLSENDLEK